MPKTVLVPWHKGLSQTCIFCSEKLKMPFYLQLLQGNNSHVTLSQPWNRNQLAEEA